MTTLFPRFPSDHGFDTLLRLLDADAAPQRHSNHQSAHSFSPKFDVKESANAYELHGELPGIEKKDIDIEFVDANTLVVKGRIEREYKKSNVSDHEAKGEKAIEGKSGNGHKSTVDDEKHGKAGTEVAKSGEKDGTLGGEPAYRYWVSERSIGQFQRTFNFPGKIDRDGVNANLKNGILAVVVPKLLKKESESRKIVIGS